MIKLDVVVHWHRFYMAVLRTAVWSSRLETAIESLYWYQVGCMIGCTCSGGGKKLPVACLRRLLLSRDAGAAKRIRDL